MDHILQTQQLTLREFTLKDFPFIIELVNSPGWIKYIGDRKIKTELEAKAYLQNGPIRSYRDNGFGLWMVEIKENKIPIGMCGIIKRGNLEHPDIGFAFLPEFTGKGYAFEIAGAVMTYATEKLNLSTILAITVPYNQPSIKLLEKIGLTFIKLFHMEGDDEELMLYRSK